MNGKISTEDLKVFIRIVRAMDSQLPKNSTGATTGFVHVHYQAYRKFLQFADRLALSHLHSRECAKSKRLELARQGRELRLVSNQAEDSPVVGVQGPPEGPPDAA